MTARDRLVVLVGLVVAHRDGDHRPGVRELERGEVIVAGEAVVGCVAGVEQPQLVAGQQHLDRLPALAVVRREPVGPDGVAMLARGVAGVAVPAVHRVADGEVVHHPVADGLGDDRGAGDRVDPRVAVDDRRVRPDLRLEVGDPQPVDEHVVVTAEPGDRAAHREVGRVVDVQPVDVGDGRRPDADRDSPATDDRRQALTLAGGQRLGVADARDPVAVGRHDDGRRDDGAARRGDADLVHARDPGRAAAPQGALPAQRRDDHGHRTLA